MNGSQINLDFIPQQLKDRDQWVWWRLGIRNGKSAKIPLIPGTSSAASPTNPSTWSSFANATERLEDRGLGWVLTKNDLVNFIDLDYAVDDKGKIQVWAQRILEQVPSYAEFSPSGSGIHIVTLGAPLDGSKKRGRVEIYSSERYMTVTGRHVPGTPLTIEQTEIRWLQRLMKGGLFDF